MSGRRSVRGHVPPPLPVQPIAEAVQRECGRRAVSKEQLFNEVGRDVQHAEALRQSYNRAVRRGTLGGDTAEKLIDALGRRGEVLYGLDEWEIALGLRPPHGTRRRYGSKAHPCRCQPCRDAKRVYDHDRALERAARPVDESRLPPHGTLRRYNHKAFPCKTCRRCKTANAKYKRLWNRQRRGHQPRRRGRRRHGTRAMYLRGGCRMNSPCPASPSCFDAHRAYMDDYRQRLREIQGRRKLPLVA